MGVLANFKIRTKILVSLLPLAIMIVSCALFSSIEMRHIDDRYSSLIEHDAKALQSLTRAQAHNNRFGRKG